MKTNKNSKVCTECNARKPLIEFHVKRSNSDSHATRCRVCSQKRAKKVAAKREAEEKRKAREYKPKYNAANQAHQAWIAEKIQETRRTAHL